MGGKGGGDKEIKKASKKQKQKHHSDATNSGSDNISFKTSADVKGLRFGGQFIVKSFTIRRANPPELIRLLSMPSPSAVLPLPSTIAFLPTNFTILAHHAWHTLTLGLGTTKSKVLIMVFESQALLLLRSQSWPPQIPLGDVNRRLIRSLSGCDLARFKFRKGCLTFYVYAVRRSGAPGFERAADLRAVLEAVVSLRDFLDHTAMLAAPNQRNISYAAASTPPSSSSVAMAH